MFNQVQDSGAKAVSLRPLAGLAGLVTLVGAIFYGYGWVMVARFYDQFNVTPERVGFGFGVLTVRIAVVAAIAIPLVGAVTFVILRLGTREVTGTFVAGSVALMLVGVFVIVLMLSDFALKPLELPAWIQSLISSGLGVISMFLMESSRPLWRKARERLDGMTLPLKVPARAVVVLIVIALFVLPLWLVPSFLTTEIKAGRPVTLQVIPGISILSVDLVEVNSLDGSGPAFVGDSCIHLLGESSGIAVFYDAASASTIRLPSSGLVIRSPCDSAKSKN